MIKPVEPVISAAIAPDTTAHALKRGAFRTGWTNAIPKDGVPSVPVVRLRNWDEQAPAREEAGRKRAKAADAAQ